jgi:4-hydroxybenzoate polyprenyltransferase
LFSRANLVIVTPAFGDDMDFTGLLDLNPWTLFLGFVFSVIGFAYYRYGKRQGETVALIVGIALMIYPLFATKPVTIVVIGLLLMAGPFVAKRVGW